MQKSNQQTSQQKNQQPSKLGVFGGTFDPIHNGHLSCAQAALQKFALDQVVFMVANNPNFKQGQTQASPADRVKMCQLAVDNQPNTNNFTVSNFEILMGGITYTSKTLTEYKKTLPQDTQLFFITGLDSAKTLPSWHEYKKIFNIANVIVVSRPGEKISSEQKSRLQQACQHSLLFLNAPTDDVSSSQIRQRLAANKSISGLVPKKVERYIYKNGLYQQQA